MLLKIILNGCDRFKAATPELLLRQATGHLEQPEFDQMHSHTVDPQLAFSHVPALSPLKGRAFLRRPISHFHTFISRKPLRVDNLIALCVETNARNFLNPRMRHHLSSVLSPRPGWRLRVPKKADIFCYITIPSGFPQADPRFFALSALSDVRYPLLDRIPHAFASHWRGSKLL